MAYCNNCGAYIPDGQTKCLACGTDETAQSAQAREERKRPDVNSETMREQLERQRRKQQENSRKWAEAERERREQARQQSESYGTQRSAYAGTGESMGGGVKINGKPLAALSYLGVLCFLPYLLCRDDDFAMFHARQGLILFAVGTILRALSGIFGFGWLVTLMWIYMICTGIGNARSGQKKPLPYIGNILINK